MGVGSHSRTNQRASSGEAAVISAGNLVASERGSMAMRKSSLVILHYWCRGGVGSVDQYRSGPPTFAPDMVIINILKADHPVLIHRSKPFQLRSQWANHLRLLPQAWPSTCPAPSHHLINDVPTLQPSLATTNYHPHSLQCHFNPCHSAHHTRRTRFTI